MRMFTRLLIVGTGFFAVAAAHSEQTPFVQIAIHGGYRAGGSLEDEVTGEDRDLDEGSSLALALELRYRPGDDRYYQLWYSRQESDVDDGTTVQDVDVEYLHLGGTVPFGDLGRAQPILAAGVGATRFSASGPSARDLTRFSGSLGLGLAMPVGEHAAFRLEARGYLTVMDSDSSIFCRADDGSAFCRIRASGSTLFQAEALAGFAVRF